MLCTDLAGALVHLVGILSNGLGLLMLLFHHPLSQIYQALLDLDFLILDLMVRRRAAYTA